METYLREISEGTRKPTISYLIGSSGIGKKTSLNKCIEKLKFKQINVNTLYNINHHYYNKKDLITEIGKIVLHQNIEFFFTHIKDIMIIHNMDTITDKAFFDSFLKLKEKNRTHIICIINTDKISARFLDYIVKNCDVFQMKPKSCTKLVEIFKQKAANLNIDYPDHHFDSIIKESNGNFHEINTQLLQYASTSKYNSSSDAIKVDKYLIENNFKFLCDNNVNLFDKIELVKAQHSLFRLLIVKHVINGLDIDTKKTFDEKLNISIRCLQKICEADKITTTEKNLNHIYMQQILFPTTIINDPNIKGIFLSNQHNENSISNSFSPFDQKEYLYIIMIIKHCVLNSLEIDVKNWIPKLNPENFLDIQKHFKIFNEQIPKRMFNEFRNKNITNQK